MKQAIAVAVLAVSLACGGGGGNPAAPPPVTQPPVPTTGSYSVTISPSPVLATPSGNADFPWAIRWSVVIADTAGLAGNVNRVVTTARNNFGFTFVISDDNPDELIAAIGSNHIPARGDLRYSEGTSYRADGNGGQQVTLTVAAEIIDDNGHHLNVASDVRVTFVPGGAVRIE